MLLVLPLSLGSVTGNAPAINLDAEDPMFESGLGRVSFAPYRQWYICTSSSRVLCSPNRMPVVSSPDEVARPGDRRSWIHMERCCRFENVRTCHSTNALVVFQAFTRRQPHSEMSGRGPVISFQGAPSGVVSEADSYTPVEMETVSSSESSLASKTMLDSGSPPSSCSHVVRFWMRKELRTRGCRIPGAAE